MTESITAELIDAMIDALDEWHEANGSPPLDADCVVEAALGVIHGTITNCPDEDIRASTVMRSIHFLLMECGVSKEAMDEAAAEMQMNLQATTADVGTS
jgi:hypothetical protein